MPWRCRRPPIPAARTTAARRRAGRAGVVVVGTVDTSERLIARRDEPVILDGASGRPGRSGVRCPWEKTVPKDDGQKTHPDRLRGLLFTGGRMYSTST